jgi:hypothetical protein
VTDIRIEFEKEIRLRGLSFVVDDVTHRFQIAFASGPVLVSLDNLARGFASDADLSRVKRFVDAVVDTGMRTSPQITTSGLLWMLEPNDYHEKANFRQAVSDRVDRVLVHLSPDREIVTWVSAEMIEQLGLSESEASELAFEHLDEELRLAKVEFDEIDDVRLGYISAPEPVKAALILAPNFRSKVEKLIGWPVLAVVPDRNFVYFWAARHEGFAGRVGQVVVEEFSRAAYPISTEVYSLSDGELKAIGEFPRNA